MYLYGDLVDDLRGILAFFPLALGGIYSKWLLFTKKREIEAQVSGGEVFVVSAPMRTILTNSLTSEKPKGGKTCLE